MVINHHSFLNPCPLKCDFATLPIKSCDDGVYFAPLWVWAGFVTCFGWQNVVEWTMCQFQGWSSGGFHSATWRTLPAAMRSDSDLAAAWWKTHVHHPLPLSPVLGSEPIWCAANPSPYQKNHLAEPSLNSLTAESCFKFGLLCCTAVAITQQYTGYPPYARNLESGATQNERYRDKEDSSYPWGAHSLERQIGWHILAIGNDKGAHFYWASSIHQAWC